ncbi:MAG: YfcC family protein [Bacteroidota bacterium]|nr:YfcC family protein [Bacteroidota bacterium]
MLKKVPHTYVIIFSIIVISAILTWFIPGGEFERETVNVNGTEREIIINNSFHYIDSSPQTWQVFSALFNGFVNTANIIAFILLIGGAFWIMNFSKAIDVGIYSFLKMTDQFEKRRIIKYLGVNNIIITMIMLLFSVFGAVFGMSEETIAFIIIFVPLSISMGYDSIVGVAMVFVAAGLGFAGAILNPFTIGIAQGLSNIPLFSGIEYRLICWIVINLVGITFVLRYARRIKKDPKKSPVYEVDQYWRDQQQTDIDSIQMKPRTSSWVLFLLLSGALIYTAISQPITEMMVGVKSYNIPALPVMAGLFAIGGVLALRKSVHYFVLHLLGFTMLYLIVGVMGYGWYVMEIASLFFAMGVFSGIAMGYSPNRITKLFLEGTKDIMSAAMVVGLAGGIIVILNDGKIIDTILYGVSQAMSDAGRLASVGLMYVFQTFLNVLIPSGSGKAALTMPIMSQFSDLIGLSRQATVMAFQFGDGFTNMITPTSGVLIGVLGVAKIPYDKWVKWVTPLMIILIIIGFLLLIPTVTMTLNGF